MTTTAHLQFASEKEFGEWFTYYYLHPQPERIITAINYSIKNGDFERQEVHHVNVTFYALLCNRHPEIAVSIRALLLGITAGAKRVLREALESSNALPKALNTMQIKNPADVDRLWTAFSATGDEVHVSKIVQVLPLTDVQDLQKVMIGEAAQWSLASQAFQHKRVFEICQKLQKVSSKKLRPYLDQAIAVAKEKLKKRPNVQR